MMTDSILVSIDLPLMEDLNGDWIAASDVLADIPAVVDSLLVDSVMVDRQDVAYRISLTADVDTCFYLLDIQTGGSAVLFFDETILVEVLTPSGVTQTPDEISRTMDGIASGTSFEYDAQGSRFRTYFTETAEYYQLNSGKYLIQLVATDQTKERTLRHVFKTGF